MKYIILFLLLMLSRYLAAILTQLHVRANLWPFNKGAKLEFKNKLTKEEIKKLQEKYSK